MDSWQYVQHGSEILQAPIISAVQIVFKMMSKFFQKHLLATNITLSVTLSGVGDLIQQKYENRNSSITSKSTITQSNLMPNKVM